MGKIGNCNSTYATCVDILQDISKYDACVNRPRDKSMCGTCVAIMWSWKIANTICVSTCIRVITDFEIRASTTRVLTPFRCPRVCVCFCSFALITERPRDSRCSCERRSQVLCLLLSFALINEGPRDLALLLLKKVPGVVFALVVCSY